MTHTTTIVLITIVVTLLAWQTPALSQRLIFYPPALKRGEFDRFITYGFIHLHTIHLLLNIVTLHSFGRLIENFYLSRLGNFGFIGFYLLAIAVSVLPNYIKYKNATHYATLGASGGVSAVLFAFILLAPWAKIYLFFFIPIPAIIFAILYTAYSFYAHKRGDDGINHMAHLTGAGFGVVATILIEPKLLVVFLHKLLTFS